MPFFCRLQTGFALRAQRLRRFLIGRLAIRKSVGGGWKLVSGGDAVLRAFRSFAPIVTMVAMT